MSIIRDVTIKGKKYLERDEIMLFIGPRQAGKTTILRQLQDIVQKEKSTSYFLNLEDPDYLELLNASPKNLLKIFHFNLKKKTFVFLDEIQYLKNPSNFLKYFYDEYKGKIKILASGSSAFYIDQRFRDSLSGRKKIFHVFTLSFREFLRFKNTESPEGTKNLSEKKFTRLTITEKEKISLLYREYLIYGGYPKIVLSPIEEKIDQLREIAYSYIKKDILEAGIRQEEIFYKLFKIFASQIGNLINSTELSGTLGVSKTLIDNYLFVMQKSFHIQLIKPFSGNIRKELTKMPKMYFFDLGLRNFFINNWNPFDLREDRGQLLENAVFRELLEKYDLDTIQFWRTVDQKEVDFIVDGKKAFEVKVGERNFHKNSYKKFLQEYPKIEFSFITLDRKRKTLNKHPIFEAWELS